MIKKETAEQLYLTRSRFRDIYPLKSMSQNLIQKVIALLFPHHSLRQFNHAEEVETYLEDIAAKLNQLLVAVGIKESQKRSVVTERFIEAIPSIQEVLIQDAEFIFEGDPAAKELDDVILTYPGFQAIMMYRLAHKLCQLSVPTIPRVITEYAHQLTGIDIHPSAQIGVPFFIDHGTGTVIGETCLIGNHVKLYQGVTLGALSVEKRFSKTKRHPTIEDRVIIYSGATILGGETCIGHDSVIGGNVWLTESVSPYTVVYHKSEVQVRPKKDDHTLIDFSI